MKCLHSWWICQYITRQAFIKLRHIIHKKKSFNHSRTHWYFNTACRSWAVAWHYKPRLILASRPLELLYYHGNACPWIQMACQHAIATRKWRYWPVSLLKLLLVHTRFLTWLLVGWQLCCQSIGSHRKIYITNLTRDRVGNINLHVLHDEWVTAIKLSINPTSIQIRLSWIHGITESIIQVICLHHGFYIALIFVTILAHLPWTKWSLFCRLYFIFR